MKKLISCLLAAMMIFMVASASAVTFDSIQLDNVLNKFLDETDLKTKDLSLQVLAGDSSADLVIRLDEDNLHLVPRENNVPAGHIQLNPTGIYVASDDSVTMLRYDTITTFMQNIVKGLEDILDEAVKDIPEEPAPTEAEIKKAVEELSILAAEAEAQEQADAATLTSAALSFAGKFKPEYILDVKEDNGSVTISLRSEAYASALADAMDELMTNPSLAKLVDRTAASEGGKSFADYQAEWLKTREATLEAIRTIDSTEKLEENGHYTSHFQIGEEGSAEKILCMDSDAWIDAEYGYAEITTTLSFQNEEPLLVYETAVNPSAYREKLSSGNSWTETQVNVDSNRVRGAKVTAVIDGVEEMKMEFGEDYLYMKGPKGGISTSVRETWTGKLRVELVVETANGESKSMIIDFYQDGDSLIQELSVEGSDTTVQFKVSRIDKTEIEDLSASEKINEVTVEKLEAELEKILKDMVVTVKTAEPTAEPETTN